MKRKVLFLTLVLVLAAAAAMTAGCEEAQAVAAQNPAAAALIPSVTADQAKEIALTDAGLAADDVVFLKTWLDVDDGVLEYDVEFYSGMNEYDYGIDANTGAIRSKDLDIESFSLAGSALASGAAPSITEEEARQIALQNAGLAEDQVVFVRSGMDFDDGRLQYEIEFYKGMEEYDYEIDANTGAILSVDRDMDIDYDAASLQRYIQQNTQAPAAQPSAPAAGPVTRDQALEIALQQAGVARNQISHTKVKLDWDDGIQVYEVEFKVGRTEYEFDIAANTGAVLKYDIDND